MGHWDFFVFSPDGQRFRSNVELNKYLENNPEVKCDRNVTNTNSPQKEKDEEQKTKSMKKPGKSPKIAKKELKTISQDFSENCENSTTTCVQKTMEYQEYALPHGWKKVGRKRSIYKNRNYLDHWDF